MPDANDMLRLYLAERDEACPGCGYNLRGLSGERCPECARELVLAVADRAVLGPRTRRWIRIFATLMCASNATAGAANFYWYWKYAGSMGIGFAGGFYAVQANVSGFLGFAMAIVIAIPLLGLRGSRSSREARYVQMLRWTVGATMVMTVWQLLMYVSYMFV